MERTFVACHVDLGDDNKYFGTYDQVRSKIEEWMLLGSSEDQIVILEVGPRLHFNDFMHYKTKEDK